MGHYRVNHEEDNGTIIARCYNRPTHVNIMFGTLEPSFRKDQARKAGKWRQSRKVEGSNIMRGSLASVIELTECTVATATFWRTFLHDGKNSPGW